VAKEIKQKIVLEGEKQYNQAIRDAQRNLRTLRSELKAETAELGKNATEQQKNEARAKSLKKQIQEQEKVVKTYREALEEVREKYGDNEDAVQKWEQKLNEARATLGNMRNDLESVGQGFRQAGADAQMGTVAAKSFADSIGKVADAGEALSSSIENIFRGMVETVSSAISAVWEDMVDLAGRANSWVDLAGFWNTDAQKIQAWTHAVEGAHDSFEDLNNAVTRINMGDQKKITEATGVSGVNYTDKWEYAMAVMDSLASMDYDKRLEAAGEVFGEKRATKVLDLLNEWSKIRENLAKFDPSQGGIGMTEEQIQDMSTLAEQVDLIKETWRAFLDSFEATHFGKLALDLTGNAQRILEDLIKFIDTGSDEDLQNLEKDIEIFFDRIKEALEAAGEKLQEAGEKLQESDNGVIRAIGKALQDLGKALDWFGKEENLQKVIHGFEVLAGFWVAGKGVKLLGSIAELAANFAIITGSNVAGAAAGAAGSAAAGLGSTIAAALTKVVLPVSLAAIVCAPLLAKLIHGETEEEKQAREEAEKAKETGEAIVEAGGGLTPEHKKATTRGFYETMLFGYSPTLAAYHEEQKQQEEEAKKAEDEGPRTYVDSTGPTGPVARARFNATSEQQAAVEAWWDAWRNMDDSQDDLYDAMAAAFGDNGKLFDEIDKWLDRLIEEYQGSVDDKDFNPETWMDIPSTWWKNPAGVADENGITSGDLQDFRSMPAGVEKAAENGIKRGLNGMRVEIDGQAAGRILAPHTSEAIAAGIFGSFGGP